MVHRPGTARPESVGDAAQQDKEHSENGAAAPARTMAQAVAAGMTPVDKEPRGAALTLPLVGRVAAEGGGVGVVQTP
jgi:hypothetical protein